MSATPFKMALNFISVLMNEKGGLNKSAMLVM